MLIGAQIRGSSFGATLLLALALVSQADAQQFGYRSGISLPVVGQSNVVSVGPNFFDGANINNLIGANTFYNNGYTGTRATVAIVEGGYAFPDHDALTNLSAYFRGTGALAPGAGSYSSHTTSTAFVAAGNDGFPDFIGRGIAYNSNLWSGNLATAFGSGGSFNVTNNSVFTTYALATVAGLGPSAAKADVVNSSWGFWVTPANPASPTAGELSNQRLIASGILGNTVAFDAVVAASKRLHVVAAGNSGTLTGTFRNVGGLGAGYNALNVGSSGPNSTYSSVSGFSSRGLSVYYNPNNGTYVEGVRARVDLVAPGEDLVTAVGNASSFAGSSGTSFSAPIVSGVGALLTDVAKDRYSSNPQATDNRVLSAVLLNSADKLSGWNNGQALSSGVIQTSQALDANIGAGQVNASKAFTQFTGGTKDVAGVAGGSVLPVGWDFGEESIGGSNDYVITPTLLAGTSFTASLRWNARASASNPGGVVSASVDALANFSLEVFRVGSSSNTLIAQSDAQYINTEHLHFTLTDTAQYFIRVNLVNYNYNFIGATSEGYGLAWSATPVPEPATLAVLGLGVLALRRRKKA